MSLTDISDAKDMRRPFLQRTASNLGERILVLSKYLLNKVAIFLKFVRKWVARSLEIWFGLWKVLIVDENNEAGFCIGGGIAIAIIALISFLQIRSPLGPVERTTPGFFYYFNSDMLYLVRGIVYGMLSVNAIVILFFLLKELHKWVNKYKEWDD